MMWLIFILLLSFLFGCEGSYVKFEEPQPSGKKDLKKFPKRLTGTYWSESDSNYVSIFDNQIIEWVNYEIKESLDSLRNELDSVELNALYRDSTLVVKEDEWLAHLSLLEDSVRIKIQLRDTIFKLSPTNLLRPLKGHYFLNWKHAEKDWRVEKISLKEGILSFSDLRTDDNLEELKEITNVVENYSDSVTLESYEINPSRKELKKLMNSHFRTSDHYMKLNKKPVVQNFIKNDLQEF